MHKAISFSYLSIIALNTKGNCIFWAYLVLPSVHDDRARFLSINDKQAFCYTNNTVSDYFHLKTDLLLKETKSGKALVSLVAPSPMPLVNYISFEVTILAMATKAIIYK